MAPKRDKIKFDVNDRSRTDTSATVPVAGDTAILRLARLIGRQIAREQFERTCRKYKEKQQETSR